MELELNPRAVATLKPHGRREEVQDTHPDAPRGFILRLSATSRVYYLRATVRGRGRVYVKIGDAAVISLDDARRAARARAGEIALGRDPNAEARQAAQQAKAARGRAAVAADEWTVRGMLEAYIAAKVEQGIAPATWRGYRNDLGLMIVGSPIETVPAREVVRDDVRRLLRSAERKHGPHMAGHALTLLRAAYRWALDEEAPAVAADGKRTVRPRVDRDPTRRIESEFPRISAAKKKKRARVLSDEEIVVFWTGLDAAQYGLQCESRRKPFCLPWLRWSAFPKLVLLNGTRRSEAHRTLRPHLQLDGMAPTWHLPAPHRKGRAEGSAGARRDLTIPLAPLSVSLFRALLEDERQRRRPATSERVFTMPISHVGEFVRKATGLEVTLHDLRRTTASGLQRLGAPPHALSTVLGHAKEAGALASDAHYAHDRRLGEHREWLRRWAEHVERLIGRRSLADVVPIRA